MGYEDKLLVAIRKNAKLVKMLEREYGLRQDNAIEVLKISQREAMFKEYEKEEEK